jgi:ribosome-associated protein
MKEHYANVVPMVTKVVPHSSSDLAYDIVAALNDAKGKDITVLDVSKVFGLSDYFIVVSGRSDRQVQGLAHRALEAAHLHGIKPVTIEGIEQGHWGLIDFGEIVLHLFYEPLREKYDIEGLWTSAPRVTLAKGRKKSTSSNKVAA